jgi:hypothetical protein
MPHLVLSGMIQRCPRWQTMGQGGAVAATPKDDQNLKRFFVPAAAALEPISQAEDMAKGLTSVSSSWREMNPRPIALP